MKLGQRYVWITVLDNHTGKVVVGLNPTDLDDYKCNCNNDKHLYYNKYPKFKCKCYKIALEKYKRQINETTKL